MAKLTKLSDDRFNGRHPNDINAGYVKEGTLFEEPEVSHSFYIGSLYTSVVTEIVSKDEKECVFKTMNSTYKLEY